MIVTPISGRAPAAIRDALLSHGWGGDASLLTAGGLEVGAYQVEGVSAESIEAMVTVAAKLGLELVTGPDWLILAGPRSRLGAFARPWVQPEPVQELAMAIGMAIPAALPLAWRHAAGEIPLEKPVIVGVVNVTPDSFSDGGNFLNIDDALSHASALMASGASILDIGGESTRPGAELIDESVEQGRVLPLISALHTSHPDIPLSIDTVHATTARMALDAGAVIVNDVTAGRHDPAMLRVVAEKKAGVILCHSRGPLGELASYTHAEYHDDVAGAVVRELAAAARQAIDAGVAAESIVLDPGFGFAKRPEQNFALLDRLDALVALGFGVLVGVSRKRFLSVSDADQPADRDRATAAACALGYDRGARMFRVHNPAAMRDALAVSAAMAGARA